MYIKPACTAAGAKEDITIWAEGYKILSDKEISSDYFDKKKDMKSQYPWEQPSWIANALPLSEIKALPKIMKHYISLLT